MARTMIATAGQLDESSSHESAPVASVADLTSHIRTGEHPCSMNQRNLLTGRCFSRDIAVLRPGCEK
jgi:hypothetical protein